MKKENFYHRYRNNKISKNRTEAWRAKINSSNSSYVTKEVPQENNQSKSNSPRAIKPIILYAKSNKQTKTNRKFIDSLFILLYSLYQFVALSFLKFWFPSGTKNSSLLLFFSLLTMHLLLLVYLFMHKSNFSKLVNKGLLLSTLLLTITFFAGNLSQVTINQKVYLASSQKAKLYKEAKTMLFSLNLLENRDSFLNNDISYLANNNIELLKIQSDDASISSYWTDKRVYTSTNTANAALLIAKSANNQKLALTQIVNELNQHDTANIPLANNYEKEARKQYLQAANLIGLEIGKFGIPLKDLEGKP